MRNKIWLALMAFTGLSAIALTMRDQTPLLIYNPTQSVPPGWYKISPQTDYKSGETVAAWLPREASRLAIERGYLPRATPILKSIAATAGTSYCVTGRTLTIQERTPVEALYHDGKERAMPALAEGCRSIKAGHVLLISTRIKTSFDSRYFGEVPVKSLLGRAEFIGDFESLWGGRDRQEGGARGPGAQGKIKGLCTKEVLQPCLHIEFYCTRNFANAPGIPVISNSDRSLRLHQFPILPDCSLKIEQ